MFVTVIMALKKKRWKTCKQGTKDTVGEMFTQTSLIGLHDSSLVKESLMLEGSKQVGQHLGLQNDAEYAN